MPLVVATVLAVALACVLVTCTCVYLLGRPPRPKQWIETPYYTAIRDRFMRDEISIAQLEEEVEPLLEHETRYPYGGVLEPAPLEPRRIETLFRSQLQAVNEMGRAYEQIFKGMATVMSGTTRWSSTRQRRPLADRPSIGLRQEYNDHGTCYCQKCLAKRRGEWLRCSGCQRIVPRTSRPSPGEHGLAHTDSGLTLWCPTQGDYVDAVPSKGPPNKEEIYANALKQRGVEPGRARALARSALAREKRLRGQLNRRLHRAAEYGDTEY